MERRIDRLGVEDAVRALLTALGEDPDREGLQDTPKRVRRFYEAFLDPVNGNSIDTTFAVEHVDELVVVSGIRVWSLCEHHLLPFWCDVAVGYITRDKLLGLSKLVRIAEKAAGGLMVQERLVQLVADDVQRIAESPDVAVHARGEHLCMSMRGVRQRSTLATTNVMRGRFRDQERARAEFLAAV